MLGITPDDIALILTLASAVGFLVGVLGFQLFDFGLDASVIGLSLGVPLELGPGALYVFSIVDAYRTAKSMERGF